MRLISRSFSCFAESTPLYRNRWVIARTSQITVRFFPGLRGTVTSGSQLLNAAPGPLPLQAGYTSSGGTLLIFAGGSAWTRTLWSTIGANVVVDGSSVGSIKLATNEVNSHKALVSNVIVAPGLPAGQHTIHCADGCGVLVYGYSDAVSYMFAGGLDLKQIVIQ